MSADKSQNWESTFAEALLPLRWHQVDTAVLHPVAKWTRDGRWAPDGQTLFNNSGEQIFRLHYQWPQD